MGGDLIHASEFVCVRFRGNNKTVRLGYFISSTGHGYRIKFTDVDTQDSAILTELKKPSVKDKILKFILAQHKGKKSKPLVV